MRYWWVNQNQTYRQEVGGGYLWSPKVKSNGHRNPYYDFMREMAPGDIVFSFFQTRIGAIGIAGSYAYEAPKPLEFGLSGAYWERIGWRVDVRFYSLVNAIKPALHMADIKPRLPKKYSPLRTNGAGLQNLYLTLLPVTLAAVLIDLIGREARDLVHANSVANDPVEAPAIGLFQWEEYEIRKVYSDESISDTERSALVVARRGQGLFKKRIMCTEKACRVTGVEREEHLRASHIKPWRCATNIERLDGENGLLLTPNADHLFDRGFISFDDSGELLLSPVAHLDSLRRMGVHNALKNVKRFSSGQQRYLDHHREKVFLRSPYLES
jgi:putative restriction endonuclease